MNRALSGRKEAAGRAGGGNRTRHRRDLPADVGGIVTAGRHRSISTDFTDVTMCLRRTCETRWYFNLIIRMYQMWSRFAISTFNGRKTVGRNNEISCYDNSWEVPLTPILLQSTGSCFKALFRTSGKSTNITSICANKKDTTELGNTILQQFWFEQGFFTPHQWCIGLIHTSLTKGQFTPEIY